MQEESLKNKKPAISVIIPIYNCEKYIERAILSIQAQDFTDWELLIIDDGSSDKSGQICDSLAQSDNRVRVCHIANGGVSAARNLGITMAKGDYITFVDADDIVVDYYLREAYHYAKLYNADVVYGNFVKCSEEALATIHPKDTDALYLVEGQEDVKELRKCLLGYNRGKYPCQINGGPVAKLYSQQILADTRFREDVRYFEDQIFNRDLLQYIEKAVVCDRTWYYYMYNPQSAMNSACDIGDFYDSLRPYWDYCYQEILQETDDVKNASRIMGMNRFIELIQTGYLRMDVSLARKLACINAAAMHPMVRDIVDNLRLNQPELTQKEKLKLLLMKKKWWLFLYVFVKKLYDPYRKYRANS